MTYLLKHIKSICYVSYNNGKFDLVGETHKATLFASVFDIELFVDHHKLLKKEYSIYEIHLKRITPPWKS